MFVRRLVSTLIVAALGPLAWTTPAWADGVSGGSQSNGYNLQAVDVVVRGGSGDPLTGGGTNRISVSVPPQCWWGAFRSDAVDSSDAEAMAAWFTEMRNQMRGHAAAGYFALPPDAEVRAVTAASENRPHTWYQLNSQDGVNCADAGFADSFGTGGDAYGGQAGSFATTAIPVSYAAFPAGAPLPPPLVDVDDVVTAVWDRAAAELSGPDLGRNPKISTAGGSTLVNLATWFWVENVQAALANDGEVRLEVSVPGTPVQATLTSSTDQVQITSPAGAQECSISAAKTEWTRSANEAGACTVPFDRANRAGWPVTAQTTWIGTWQGTDRNGPAGGTLDTLTPSATIQVPVAESEALVNDVD